MNTKLLIFVKPFTPEKPTNTVYMFQVLDRGEVKLLALFV